MDELRLATADDLDEEVVQGLVEDVADDVFRFLVNAEGTVLAILTSEGENTITNLLGVSVNNLPRL